MGRLSRAVRLRISQRFGRHGRAVPQKFTSSDRFGKPRYGDKTPLYGRHLAEIEKLLPEAHFIHIIRDGRDVAASLRTRWFSPGHDMATQARYRRDNAEAAHSQGRACRRYRELLYEDLLREPERSLRSLCDFLKLGFEPAMLAYYETAPERLRARRGSPDPAGRHDRRSPLPRGRNYADSQRSALQAEGSLADGTQRPSGPPKKTHLKVSHPPSEMETFGRDYRRGRETRAKRRSERARGARSPSIFLDNRFPIVSNIAQTIKAPRSSTQPGSPRWNFRFVTPAPRNRPTTARTPANSSAPSKAKNSKRS